MALNRERETGDPDGAGDRADDTKNSNDDQGATDEHGVVPGGVTSAKWDEATKTLTLIGPSGATTSSGPIGSGSQNPGTDSQPEDGGKPNSEPSPIHNSGDIFSSAKPGELERGSPGRYHAEGNSQAGPALISPAARMFNDLKTLTIGPSSTPEADWLKLDAIALGAIVGVAMGVAGGIPLAVVIGADLAFEGAATAYEALEAINNVLDIPDRVQAARNLPADLHDWRNAPDPSMPQPNPQPNTSPPPNANYFK